MTSKTENLAGLRILVVEDTLLVAEVIADILEDCGCTVVGPAGRVQAGLDLAETERLDGAILDINLAGQLSFPVAAALAARNVPMVFLTGYDDAALFPPEFLATPRMAKPFHNKNLVDVLRRQFGKSDARVITE